MKSNLIILLTGITICKSEKIILKDDWSIDFKGRGDFKDTSKISDQTLPKFLIEQKIYP